MFKKITQRWVSILLSLVLISQMVPAQAFANEAESIAGEKMALLQADPRLAETEPGAASIEVANDNPEIAEIVAEIPEGRDEFQKEFLLSNGLRMFSIYGNAVHYKEDGEWKEIDNTLQPVSSTGTLLTGKAALNTAVAYTNTAGIWNVTLPTGLNSNSPVSVSRDGYSLSFRFTGELHNNHMVMSTGGDVALTALAGDAAVGAPSLSDDSAAVQIGEITTPLQTSSAQLIAAHEPADYSSSFYEETILEKLNTALVYKNIYANTDLRYDLTSHTLKESVIINSPSDTLAGYSYFLSTEGLVLELQDDNSILAYAVDAEAGDAPIFTMPAPYLVDAAYAYSADISVSLVGGNGSYTLTYRLPRQWMADDHRVYPVTLDPVVNAISSPDDIEDQSVFQYDQFGYGWEFLEAGYDPDYGKERIFIKFNALPELSSADVIVSATLQLHKVYSTSSVVMEAHEVQGNWASSSINWSNMPATNEKVEDYQNVGPSDWYSWDITNIAQKWYTNNTGIMLRMSNDVENGTSANYHKFRSSDAYTNLPAVYITYLNNSGLESYWDYTSQSAGRAGTGYVNNFTGNLVWIHDDMSFAGNRMPVSISHVYNANDKNNNDFGMGFGWRTNYNQRVYQWTENSNYYIWEDQDGTLKYFVRTSGSTYVNEVDNTLTLTTNGTGDEKYCIADKDGNKSYFDANGRLKKIANNQATKSNITITYNGSSNYITSVKDGAGRVYEFTYTANLLSEIAFKGTTSSSIYKLTYTYDGSNLSQINYPENQVVNYGYHSNHLLASATDVSGYKVDYEYTTTASNAPNRINKITESDGSSMGGQLEISYAHNETTFKDHNNNKEIVQFNKYGSTVSIQDGQGRAQFAEYGKDDNPKSQSQLVLSSKLIGTPNSAIATDGSPNLVSNGDFQNGTTGWVKNSSCTSDDTVSPADSSAAPQLNASAYKIEGSATAEKKVYQTITASGSEGDVFTLAGWAKGDSVPLDNGPDRRFGLAVKFIGADGTEGTEHLVSFNPDSNSKINWQYAATKVVADKAYSFIRVELLYCDNQNDAFFDGIQLYKEEFGQSYDYDEETGLVTSVIDMQKNRTTYEYENNQLTAIFEEGSPRKCIAEYEYDSYNNVTKAVAEDGTTSHFVYDTYGNNIAVAMSKSDAQLQLNATSVSVASGGPVIAAFATYTSNGNLLSTVTDPLGKLTTYGYEIKPDNNAPQTGLPTWVQAPGETSSNRTVYSYDSLYRTKSVDQGSANVAYTYDTDLLNTIKSASNTTYDFNYGIFDLVENVKIDSRTLISHEYSSDFNRYLIKSTYGNNDYISYTYDNLGRTTSKTYEDGDTVSYAYDIRGNLGTVTDSATGRTTKYYYDFQDRLSRYEETGSGHSNVVTWNYDTKNNLTSQTQVLNGTTYTTNYSYNNDTNRLTSSAQGNASSNYTYDDLGRMTGITEKNGNSQVVHTTIGYTDKSDNANITSLQVATWNNNVGGAYNYTYDARGNIATVSFGGKTTRYTYDALNQLIREDNQAAGKTWTYSYDSGGNITAKYEFPYTTDPLDVNNAASSQSYTYDDATWKDLLTYYGSQRLFYDRIGNLSGDNTWGYSWEHGRTLRKMLNITADTSITYTYNADGMRTAKNVNGTVYNYHYVGDQLTEMTWGSNKMAFVYDVIGPTALIYNGTTYYYLRNAQGDVTGIVNTSGNKVADYHYDAWGNHQTVSGAVTSTVGNLNPLRYRGYVYDTETGLYYLQSRYYNPAWGRFINADTTAVLTVSPDSATWDKNLFAYCDNNPVSRKDDGGEYWHIVIGAGLGVASQVIGDLLYAHESGVGFWEIVKSNPGNYVQAAFSGAISAAIGNPFLAGGINALGGAAVNQLTNCIVYNDPWNWKEYGVDVLKTASEELVSFAICPAVPDSIGDIKVEARANGVKGTNALKDYLTYKQVDAYSTTTVWGAATAYLDYRTRRATQ